jgi:hypothetical protein
MNAIACTFSPRIHVSLALALALASTACSTGVPSARLPSASSGPAACHITGGPRVLARRVFVPGGVEATAEGGGFSVRFAPTASRCVSVDAASASETPRPASCPTPGGRTVNRENASDETMLAWESHADPEPHITLGVVTYDAPHAYFGGSLEAKRRIVERTFHAPGASLGSGETAPDLAPIGHDRFLLAWVDGGVESHQLRAQSVVGWGDPIGPAMVLSSVESSVIGRPSVAVAPTGYGVVTYIASTDGEFDVLATPIACAMN